MEIWKDIEGYEGLYQVSDQGRVKSLQYGKERILKPGLSKYGYLSVTLYKDGNKKIYRVNRLVALAFIPNDDPEHKTQCNHINELTTDNRAVNLNWMTPKENINWCTCIERRTQKKSKAVKQLTLDGVLVAIWSSTAEVGRNGFNQGHISSCCNGRLKQYKGYKWKYA